MSEKHRKYTCRKCGCERVEIHMSGKKTGIYCAKCGAWIMWFNQSPGTTAAIGKSVRPEDMANKVAKRVYIYNGVTTIRCEKCGCLLYSSDAEISVGQFDLLDASFCPKCGAEFIDVQKHFRKK